MDLEPDSVPVLDLLLNKENPRHVPKRNQEEIIEYLCEDERVEALARHISLHGSNPLELIAVFRSGKDLIVAEGNRRVCAMQLLNDPEKAPAKLKSTFRRLSQNKLVPDQANVLIFDTYEDARPWLEILHDGPQDGVGRQNWNAEQKTRSLSKRNRNTLAQKILDYAEQTGAIDAAARKKTSLTTAARYINNPDVRSAMGITTSPTDPEVTVDVSEAKFDAIVGQFVADLKSKKLTSRSDADDWRNYAKQLRQKHKPEESKEAPRSLFESGPSKGKGKKKKKQQPRIPKRIPKSEDVVAELARINSLKLSNLYKSLTGLSLKEHPALLMAGSWIFMESATALAGRQNASFESYLNSKFNDWNFSRDKKKELSTSVKYIADHGNAEKHGAQFTTLNAENLVTHFAVLEHALIRLLKNIKAIK